MDANALWQKYAQVYDGLLKLEPYRNLLLEVVNVAGITSGMKVLDAGCGTGNLVSALGQLGVAAQVVGIDFTPAMLEVAAGKGADYSGSLDWQEADLNQPVPTWKVGAGFDRIIFNNSLCVIDDPVEVLRKAATIAKSDAVLVVSTPRPNPSVNEVLDEHLRHAAQFGQSREQAMQAIVPILQPLIEINMALFEHYGADYHLPSRDQLAAWLDEAGWEVSDIEVAYAGQNWLARGDKKQSS